MLTGGHSQVNRAPARRRAQAELARRAHRLAGRANSTPISTRHYPAYWLRVDLPHKIAHARFIRAAEAAGKTLATQRRPDASRGVTEITVFAPDHPRLLSIIAGACTVAGANIVDAQIFTTTDGQALDTISYRASSTTTRTRSAAPRRIGDLIEQALSRRARLPEPWRSARRRSRGSRRSPSRPRSSSTTMVEPVHRHRGLRPRPARPALRSDAGDLGPQPQHRLGPHRDLRRARRRRLLRDRSDRPQDRQPDPPDRHQAAADRAVHHARGETRQGNRSRLISPCPGKRRESHR